MSTEIKNNDIIFNFFKQICDEKDNVKCIELGNSWIAAMETNLTNMEKNLEQSDKIKYKKNIESNQNHLNNLKNKTSTEWREYAMKCMIEILEDKKKV
mgnify:CR=1 FL=1|jgi:hypothetical protein|tara:strand:+ start:188 stop:481 length:294 start_codon:yes stop_codon:yes gene_type:complete